jgi:hypothetical protein
MHAGGSPRKPDGVRQRRNKPKGAASLARGGGVAIPPLPIRKPAWSTRSRELWASIWQSPLGTKYVEVGLDKQVLYMAMELVQQFWENPDARMHAEIRHAFDTLGLTPLARMRLGWTFEDKPEKKATPQYDESEPEVEDPRKVLRMVK